MDDISAITNLELAKDMIAAGYAVEIDKLTQGLIDATNSMNHVTLAIVTLGNVIAKHKRFKMYQRRYARRGGK